MALVRSLLWLLCEQCGARVVQCPTDVLAFTNPDGERVPPEAIRRHKLNLLGRRDQYVTVRS